jgi:cell division protein FtsI/penicillin-binding protein 2
MVAVAGSLLYRLFFLSYLNHGYYSRTAENQNEKVSNVLARGNIYFREFSKDNKAMSRDLYLAATNKKFPLAYAVPSHIKEEDSASLAESLAVILDKDRDELVKILGSGSRSFKILKKKLSTAQVDKINGLNKKGIGITYETDRFYPGQELAASVIGFVGYNEAGERTGQYGVEAFYDKQLFGREWRMSKLDGPFGFGKLVNYIRKAVSKEKVDVAKEEIDRPAELILTIDKNIQAKIEIVLDGLMEKYKAQSATVIVQDPETGKILAMSDRPTFNPNSYADFPIKSYLNKSVQEEFEPGSSFKPITMAMGIDLNKVTPQTTFTDTGFVDIAGYTIKNFNEKSFGTVTMSKVLEKSINTGAMFVQERVGDDNFLNYVINMGFGQQSGIDLPGEVSGDIANLYSGRKINYMTASFGQGIAVTPIQLVNAFSAIANGGKLMKPYVVEKIIKENGEEIFTQPEVVGIPISEKTSAKLKAMLVSVVDNGFDKAKIPGYDIAGKTGTAQIADGQGQYLEGEFMHDFLGFAPAFNPKFVILIKLEKPQGITFAADSLSPAFKEISSYLINYFNIPPARNYN